MFYRQFPGFPFLFVWVAMMRDRNSQASDHLDIRGEKIDQSIQHWLGISGLKLATSVLVQL
jgi:hypothetical protein